VHSLDLVQAIGSMATSIGVFLAWLQLRSTREQARLQFEDRLVEQFRAIARELPIEALLGEELPSDIHSKMLGAFYRYFDLCNEQAFLYRNRRIRKTTWRDWQEGIRSLIRLPAFTSAWAEIENRAGNSFGDLRSLGLVPTASLVGKPVGKRELSAASRD